MCSVGKWIGLCRKLKGRTEGVKISFDNNGLTYFELESGFDLCKRASRALEVIVWFFRPQWQKAGCCHDAPVLQHIQRAKNTYLRLLLRDCYCVLIYLFCPMWAWQKCTVLASYNLDSNVIFLMDKKKKSHLFQEVFNRTTLSILLEAPAVYLVFQYFLLEVIGKIHGEL